MLIKLTHKGRPTLVNTKQIVSVYMDTDLKCGEYKAKVNFTQGCVFVDESLQDIQQMMWDAENGKKPDMDYEVPTIDERMENSYNSYDNSGQQFFQRPRTRKYQPRNGKYYNNYME